MLDKGCAVGGSSAHIYSGNRAGASTLAHAGGRAAARATGGREAAGG